MADRGRRKRAKIAVSEIAARAESPWIGQVVLDRYAIESELGAGAMGVVFRGRHVKLKRAVAIKVMHAHLGHEPILLERFRREARLAAKLHHANVVAVLDVGEGPDGSPLMVLEFAEGKSLTSVMATRLSKPRIIHLLAEILRGLDHAHAAGLIHRDLKPDNVIVQVDEQGVEIPRIVDFGIAVLRSPDEALGGGKLTDTGMILGTPQYMSPEQAKGDAVDHRTDLFALGVILFEMLAGTTPFDGNAMEVALANIGHDLPPIAKRSPGVEVDPLLDAFMRKLAARRLSNRFESAKDALDTLELLQRDPAAAAPKLGIINRSKATAVVSLPELPRKRR